MQPESHDSPPSARGRDLASKPLVGSSAPSRPSSTSGSVNSHPSNLVPEIQPASSAETSPKSAAQGSSSTTTSEPDFVVKNVTVTTQTWGRRPSPPPTLARFNEAKVDVAPEHPSSTLDSVQVTAEAYPWLFMTSTLEACFDSSTPLTNGANGETSGPPGDLSGDLDSEKFAKAAPAIMQTFHSHGDACAKAETDSLKLAMRGPPDADVEDPLQDYYNMLDHLGRLQTEATELETSIVELTSEFKENDSKTGDSARSRILEVISGCLPVVRARISNLSMAQDLVDSAQENVSLGLRMENLGLDW